MKSNSKKLVILLILGLVYPLILNFNIQFRSKSDHLKIINLRHSGGYNESSIHVTGATWASTASSEPWCYLDNGVYIIENVTVNATSSPTGSGILIENSVVDFIIRNCTVYNAGTAPGDAGIKLYNTNNGILFNNTCSNNGNNGIMVYWNCQDNNLSRNIVFNNQWSGIYFSQNCIYNNISDNIAYDNMECGLYIWNDCNNNILRGNIAYDNDDAGIRVHETSINNLVTNNTLTRNRYGIDIWSSDSNTIKKNIATENTYSGIRVYSGSDSNEITENTAEGNYRNGVELSTSLNWNNITKNVINDNKITGIFLKSNSNNNQIKNNTINRNDLGILLSSSNSNNVSDNNIKHNNWCIFETGSTGNLIINNDCTAPLINETIFIDGAATGVGAHNWTWAESQAWCSGFGTEEDPYVIENLKISGFGINNGIEIINSDVHFIILKCQIYNCHIAIHLDNVNNSQLTKNNCSNNLDMGILVDENCVNNYLTNNEANNNRNYGIALGDYCDNNTISQNTACYNGEAGIILSAGDLRSSYYNSFIDNIVYNNTYGIHLEDACHYTIISENHISGNEFGIFLQNAECSNNSIYNNCFVANKVHAIDDGVDNKWNSTTIGNYWDNHTSPDDDKDGIVDNP
ncbi:MAG: NosD domain-containing protein, partial [Promethearchaeota archaeon]